MRELVFLAVVAAHERQFVRIEPRVANRHLDVEGFGGIDGGCFIDVVVEELPGRGTLWTWTVQQFMPKSPYKSGETMETFRPYGVGYLELPGGVRVEGRLLENDPASLHIGMEMDVVFDTFRTEPNGDEVVSFFFKPVA